MKYMNNLGRSKRRWEDNIKINLKETELNSVQWIRLTEGWYEWKDFVNMGVNISVPQYAKGFFAS